VLDQVQVQQVELAVLLRPDEDGVDQGGDGLVGTSGAGDAPADPGRGPLEGPAHGDLEQMLLALEVVQHHALADAGLVGHVLERQPVAALAGDDLVGAADQVVGTWRERLVADLAGRHLSSR
jgi:hypothetical protein